MVGDVMVPSSFAPSQRRGCCWEGLRGVCSSQDFLPCSVRRSRGVLISVSKIKPVQLEGLGAAMMELRKTHRNESCLSL